MRGHAFRIIVACVLITRAASATAQVSRQPCRDFGSDWIPDVVWQHPMTGALLVTTMGENPRTLSTSFAVPRPISFGGALMAVNCMDKQDEEPDLVMQDPLSGGITIVRMHNMTPIEVVPVPSYSAYQVVATADFDNNNSIDLILQDPSFGTAWIQYMNGTSAVRTEQLSPPQTGPWRIVTSVDLAGCIWTPPGCQ